MEKLIDLGILIGKLWLAGQVIEYAFAIIISIVAISIIIKCIIRKRR